MADSFEQTGERNSAFVTPNGLYQYKVMPFGIKNSLATFQPLINHLIADIDGCEAYIDDVIMYSWETHLVIMRKFFQQISEANLKINLVKSEFGCGHVTYLGHNVGQSKVKPINAKIEAICAFPQPSTKKQVMHFLSMAGYYREFCPNSSTVSEPLLHFCERMLSLSGQNDVNQPLNDLKPLTKVSLFWHPQISAAPLN